jgi:hypothetical protein
MTKETMPHSFCFVTYIFEERVVMQVWTRGSMLSMLNSIFVEMHSRWSTTILDAIS